MTIEGLHHITLGALDAQRTVDFYTPVLGQRFVKKTVNFDDPGSYHLYFGDEAGHARHRPSPSSSGPARRSGRPGHRRHAPLRASGGGRTTAC